MGETILGIDLGTTNSCVAVLEGSQTVVIHNQEGGRTTPSMVSWSESGEVLVGVASKRQMVTNPERTVFAVKRLIGRRHDSDMVAALAKNLPYRVVPADNGDAWVQIDERRISPQEVSALILGKIKSLAEEYLGHSVTEAIVTVPAYFDEVQRRATRDAGRIAGLEIRSILNEPTAAALAYGIHKGTDQNLVVFDLGGGTFDVSVLRIESGVFEVLATSGDTMLGGDDFDRLIIERLAEEFRAEHGINLLNDPIALQRLKESAERAKVELSSAMTTELHLPFIAADGHGPKHLQRELTRGEVDSACRALLDRLEPPCRKALAAAGLTSEDIDQILLVGGMTRMPAVAARVIDIFGKPPSKGVNPDEIVAMGAAVQSAIIGGEIDDVVLLDVTPQTVGVRVAGGRMAPVVLANTAIPARAEKMFATTEDDQSFVAIEVFQGESDTASDNRMLGRFMLGDLPPGPRGRVRVTVAFTIDADGLMEVTATESVTGKRASVRIEAQSGLSAAELARLTSSMRSMQKEP